MTSPVNCLTWVGIGSIIALFPVIVTSGQTNEDADFFESHIRPLLVSQCLDCHGPDESSGGLRVDSLTGLLAGGEHGPAIVPGDVSQSLLIQAVRQSGELRMPPDSRLNARQVELLEEWIARGAHWPSSPPVSQREATYADHWAFRPIARPVPPKCEDEWCRNAIDQFVRAKQIEHRLGPAPMADRRTLIRRATYALTGLPPTLEDLNAYLREPGSDAEVFERLVDRLLESPQYGVHWARHWLDVARYADSKGYVAGTEERFFIQSAPYRDWVVDAFNRDLPYNQFLLLQLAADQMYPDDPRHLAAMGFLTLGRRFQGVTHDIIDDRIDVISRGTMGLTVACARCHDHKYDPIPTADYYALYGVFQNCVERQVRIDGEEAQHWLDPKLAREVDKRQQKLAQSLAEQLALAHERVRGRIADYLLAQLELHKYPEEGFGQVLGVNDIIPMIVRRWQLYLQNASKHGDGVFHAWHRFAELPANEFAGRAAAVAQELCKRSAEVCNPLVAQVFRETPPTNMRDVAMGYAQIFADIEREWQQWQRDSEGQGGSPPIALPDAHREAIRQVLYGPQSPCRIPDEPLVNIEYYFDRGTREKLWTAQSAFDRLLLQSPRAPTFAVGLFDRPLQREPRVFRRGNPANKGEPIARRFLTVVAGRDAPPFQRGSGRLELAEAIVHPDNPLPARVWVNRIWMHHFGQGLVATPSDFGVRSEPPSHPELLDWLATQLQSQGWSTKAIHRSIMHSATYQQASVVSPASEQSARQVDPENRWLWRMNPRRLKFEELRDTLLSASGELDLCMGDQPHDLFLADDSNRRRTIYGLVDRQYLPSAHRVFDFANPDLHIPVRSETSIPQQALFGLNHPFVANRARSIVTRLNLPQEPEGRSIDDIDRLFWQIYQREPTARQRDGALDFLVNPQPSITTTLDRPDSEPNAWRHGYASEYGPDKLDQFQPFPHFTGSAWQGGATLPNRGLGSLQLTASGGNAGNEVGRAVVRRWIAPRDLDVRVTSAVEHAAKSGDGIECWIVSSRSGIAASAKVHAAKQTMNVDGLSLKTGDFLDFAVSGNDDSEDDDFTWDPQIETLSPRSESAAADVEGRTQRWIASQQFAGPRIRPLGKWEQLAQVLLLSNELAFVD